MVSEPRRWTLVGGSSPDTQMFSGPALAAMEQAQAVEADWLREYLDGSIRAWRKMKDEATGDAAQVAMKRHTATCYVDAFQSVRTSVFGETLP